MLILPMVVAEVPHARAALRVEAAQAAAGKPFLAAIEITTDPHWHVYWKNPGDSGIPTKIDWQAPKGWKVQPLEFPVPTRFAPGGIAGYGYEGKTLFLARITPTTKGTQALSARVNWLVCRDACVPGSAIPATKIKVSTAAKKSAFAPAIQRAYAALPRPAAPTWSFGAIKSAKTITLTVRAPARLPTGTPAFFPLESGIIDHEKPASATLRNGKLVLQMSVSPFPEGRTRLAGVLVAPKGTSWPGGQRALVVDARLESGDPR